MLSSTVYSQIKESLHRNFGFYLGCAMLNSTIYCFYLKTHSSLNFLFLLVGLILFSFCQIIVFQKLSSESNNKLMTIDKMVYKFIGLLFLQAALFKIVFSVAGVIAQFLPSALAFVLYAFFIYILSYGLVALQSAATSWALTRQTFIEGFFTGPKAIKVFGVENRALLYTFLALAITFCILVTFYSEGYPLVFFIGTFAITLMMITVNTICFYCAIHALRLKEEASNKEDIEVNKEEQELAKEKVEEATSSTLIKVLQFFNVERFFEAFKYFFVLIYESVTNFFVVIYNVVSAILAWIKQIFANYKRKRAENKAKKAALKEEKLLAEKLKEQEEEEYDEDEEDDDYYYEDDGNPDRPSPEVVRQRLEKLNRVQKECIEKTYRPVDYLNLKIQEIQHGRIEAQELLKAEQDYLKELDEEKLKEEKK